MHERPAGCIDCLKIYAAHRVFAELYDNQRTNPGTGLEKGMSPEIKLARNGQASSLRAIIERLPDGIVIVDSHGIIRFANPAAERLFGWTADELVGTVFGFPVVVGETTEIDIVQRGGGAVVYAELRVVETEWEEEQVQIVSLRDITDRKQAQERARQLTFEREARLAAESASRAKSDFLAIMSHELRTPLNAVLGYSELMELGISGPVTDVMREQIGRIRVSANHLLGLVNDILDLAKVEAGRLEVTSRSCSVAGTVTAAISLIQPQAAAGGLALTVVPGTDPSATYRGDDERVRQILVNLLSNAVKFTPAGGRITVETSSSGATDPDARLQPGRSYVSFRITDTGAGIPEEKLQSIFDPFVQVESGHSRTREGSGLGLTISRRLARLMGGDLTVTSEFGEGSRFTLSLPEDTSAHEVESAPAIAGAGATVQPRLEGLSEIGRAMLRALEGTVETIVERVSSDPNLEVAAGLSFSQLADHLAAMLADVGGALLVMEDARSMASPMLADAVEIQRLIAERHGAQRQRLGWNEAALRREFMIVREELENVVRRAADGADSVPIEDRVTVIGGFLDQAEYIAVRTLNAGRKS